ncbi:peptidoglycan DL-endopeptidase LytF [Microdochium nivale]|nr:peptidoglycan DL-endopeptidase LytF [Microdochium nivale]
MPYDENTISECTWWYDNDGSTTCANLLRNWGIPLVDFMFWQNPSLTSGCGNFNVGRSYCIEAPISAPPAPSSMSLRTTSTAPTTTTRTSTSSSKTSVPTTPTNGIETPLPIRPDMVANCNGFYLVQSGDTCTDIAAAKGITLQQLITWNKLNAGCTDIWAQYWVCVHVIGQASTTRPPTTTTRPTTTTTTRPTTTTGNGINTPSQPSPRCIAARNGVTVARFISWNKSLTAACTTLWANANVCVRTIGFKPTTQSTCSSVSTDKLWGDNKPEALNSVTKWCDGNASSDGSGAFAVGQSKRGCYNAPFGTNKIEFWLRNDFTIGTSLSVALCNELVKVPINSCTRGGTGVNEGWWIKAMVTAGRC